MLTIRCDAQDPDRLQPFWDELVPADGTVQLRFVAGPASAPSARTLHVHLTSTSLEDQQATVDRVLTLGGRYLDVGQADQDGETAARAPEGGTKVAWGGPPVAAKHGRNPQRFTLAADPERLLALGATRLGERELADPDGNEIELLD